MTSTLTSVQAVHAEINTCGKKAKAWEKVASDVGADSSPESVRLAFNAWHSSLAEYPVSRDRATARISTTMQVSRKFHL